jgi:hypothetical protein
MRIYTFLFAVIFIGMLLGLNTNSNSQPSTEPSSVRLPMDSQATIAVMPFFSGKWQPGTTEKTDQTLACTLAQICRSDPNIKTDADQIVTSMAYAWLARHVGEDRLIPLDQAASTFERIQVDADTDTPRSLAVKLGAALGADLVLAGTVWRFRDRGAVEGITDSPAAVAFAVYLIDAKTGRRKWRGVFDMAQNQMTDDLLKARQHARLGIGWLSAEELAKAGVDQVLKKMSL